MNTNKRSGGNNKDSINAKVEKGTELFNDFQHQLEEIIDSLKKQHASMLGLNKNRLNTAKLLESCTADSPLGRITGKSNATAAANLTKPAPIVEMPHVEEEVTEKFLVLEDEMDQAELPEMVTESVTGSDSSESSVQTVNLITGTDSVESKSSFKDAIEEAPVEIPSKANDATDEEDEKLESDAEVEEEDDGTCIIAYTDTLGLTSLTVVEQDVASEEEEQEEEQEQEDTEDNDFKVEVKQEQPAPSSIDVHLAAFELAQDHANLFKTQIIGYAEEYHSVVTTRIKSRMIEFDRLSKNLEHYEKKVQGLTDNVEKAKAQSDAKQAKSQRSLDSNGSSGSLFTVLDDVVKGRNDSFRIKKIDQLERNKLKLGGARDAHTIYGESLYLLIDEVVKRCWRDVFPVLLRTINFDMHQSKCIATVYADFQALANELEMIGIDKGISPQGRLKDLAGKHPEEVYTGTELMVRPVLKST